MNKREFIAELWNQVDELSIKLNIKCSKCLDMKKLWTTMKDDDAYMLVSCYKCCNQIIQTPLRITQDCEFYGDIGEKRVLLFEDRNDTPGIRVEILKELMKEIEEREFTRITDVLIKRDKEFADGSTIERFGGNKSKEFVRTLHYNRLQTEYNELLQKIVKSHDFPWKKKHESPIAFLWPNIYTQVYCWDVIEDMKMYPTYLFIRVQAYNYMNWLKIVDSCSLFSDDVHIQIKTYVFYPMNDCALDICRRIAADVSHNQPLLDKFILS